MLVVGHTVNHALCNNAGAAGRFVYRFCVMRAQNQIKRQYERPSYWREAQNVIDLYRGNIACILYSSMLVQYPDTLGYL